MQTLPLEPEEERRAAALLAADAQRWHIRRERVKDTSVSFTLAGVPATPGVGSVAHSKTFRTERAAQREADAWNGQGDFERHGPTDWQAEVKPGRAPRQGEAEAGS